MKALKYLSQIAVTAVPFAGAIAQTPPPAQPPAQESQPQQQGATFESLDTNGDGRISKTEAESNASVSAQFSRYDRDGNGYIEKAEVTSTNQSTEQPAPK